MQKERHSYFQQQLSYLMVIVTFFMPVLSAKSQTTTPHKVVYISSVGNSQKLYKMGEVVKYPLKVSANALYYVQNKNEKIILIKGPKSLSQNEIEKLFSYEKGISQTYFSYVLKKMTAHNEVAQNSFGGVSRNDGFLQAISPKTGENILTDTIRFAWTSKPNINAYYFNITDSDGDVIFKTKVTDTFFVLFHEYNLLNDEGKYGWFVSELPYGANTIHTFTIASKDSIKVFLTEEKRLLAADTSAENTLNLIGFYMSQKAYDRLEKILPRLEKQVLYENMIADIKKWLLLLNDDE